MCGICVILTKSRRQLEDADLPTSKFSQDTEKHGWKELLSNRGPDLEGSCVVNVHDVTNNVIINAEFCGYVLHLRGVPTKQPLTDAKGNILLWNGEIFEGNIQVKEDQNDGEELLRKLSCMSSASNDDEIIQIFQQIHGPWAFIYFQVRQKKLWFGRDFFGRRSLLWHLPETASDTFVLTSTVMKNSGMEFTEVPAKMIYCINVDRLAAMWPNEDHKLKSNNTDTESYLTTFPIAVPNCVIKADIPTLEDIRFLCLKESKISTGNNQLGQASLNYYQRLKKKIKNLDKCLVSGNYKTHMIQKCLNGGIVDDSSIGGCFKFESPGEMETKHYGYLTAKEPITDNASMEGLNEEQNDGNEIVTRTTTVLSEISLANDKTELDSNEADPPGSDTELYRELLNYYVTYFQYFLETATTRRVFNLPREDCIDSESIKQDLDARTKNTNDRTPKAAKVGILFSGGIDSMVLAAVADKCVPSHEAIDLLNVAFEQQPPHTNSKNSHRKKEAEPRKDPFEVPDRISGRAGVKELNPKRRWNFVEINITLEDVKVARAKHIRHLVYPLQTVLDDSLGCAIWFAAKGKGTNYIYENGELVKMEESYTSNTKVLLAGMGADEQLGGYARHRSKFEKFGWKGLEEEIEMELQRISSRNLGRDDRCISDHGREARFPFLDEDVVAFLQQVPVWIKCDPRLQRGYGEKRLLREVARRLGLHGCAVLPKRAIQFGSKIAKMENSKEKGSDSCNRLETNDI